MSGNALSLRLKIKGYRIGVYHWLVNTRKYRQNNSNPCLVFEILDRKNDLSQSPPQKVKRAYIQQIWQHRPQRHLFHPRRRRLSRRCWRAAEGSEWPRMSSCSAWPPSWHSSCRGSPAEPALHPGYSRKWCWFQRGPPCQLDTSWPLCCLGSHSLKRQKTNLNGFLHLYTLADRGVRILCLVMNAKRLFNIFFFKVLIFL